MTKDEAIKVWDASPDDFLGPKDIIEKFVALGMLKLDEPKSPNERAVDAMFAQSANQGGVMTPRHAMQAIDDAGLKIVEK